MSTFLVWKNKKGGMTGVSEFLRWTLVLDLIRKIYSSWQSLCPSGSRLTLSNKGRSSLNMWVWAGVNIRYPPQVFMWERNESRRLFSPDTSDLSPLSSISFLFLYQRKRYPIFFFFFVKVNSLSLPANLIWSHLWNPVLSINSLLPTSFLQLINPFFSDYIHI